LNFEIIGKITAIERSRPDRAFVIAGVSSGCMVEELAEDEG
jgi:hypothetical protein